MSCEYQSLRGLRRESTCKLWALGGQERLPGGQSWTRSCREGRIWRRQRGPSRLAVSTGTKHSFMPLPTESGCAVSLFATRGPQCFCSGTAGCSFHPSMKHQAEMEKPLHHVTAHHSSYVPLTPRLEGGQACPSPAPPSSGNSRKLHSTVKWLPFSGPQFPHW